ncbi:hypothetical protein MRB53_016729 [Persea americana]|uniref:Uncharacterized protein n=1 Tax=Persea americana TaxID=3435 RepID=A0ACC2M337_PERAE|nr:hypothetical protein MRB53_016729 [Persea americana]
MKQKWGLKSKNGSGRCVSVLGRCHCSKRRVYCPTPIQRVLLPFPPPPPPPPSNPHHHLHHLLGIARNDWREPVPSFSSPVLSRAYSFVSSLTRDTDTKYPSASSAFRIMNLSQAYSGGRSPL